MLFRRRSAASQAAWSAVAFALTLAVELDRRLPMGPATSVLVLALVGFWVALPGGASIIAITLASMFASFVFRLGPHVGEAPSFLVIRTCLSVGFGAAAGWVAGHRLDISRSGSGAAGAAGAAVPWYRRGLEARVLIPVALTVIVAAGLVPTYTALRQSGVALVERIFPAWQALTFVMWIVFAPWILELRPVIRRAAARAEGDGGLSIVEAALYAAVVFAFMVLHGLLLIYLATAMGQPPNPLIPGRFWFVWRANISTYATTNLLCAGAVLGFAYISDSQRHAAAAFQRERALQSAILEKRLDALRARLNPHFLYNALNAAVMLARENRGQETSAVLEKLTRLLRYALDDRAKSVTLADELAFVREYLAIQGVRFGDRLTWTVDVDDDRVLSARLPPLVLQPIVENAVEHGMRGGDGRSVVSIGAKRENGSLVLTVLDDGPGPTAANETSGLGIGLAATRERLSGLFGDRARVSLERRDGGGTRATVALPFSVGEAPSS